VVVDAVLAGQARDGDPEPLSPYDFVIKAKQFVKYGANCFGSTSRAPLHHRDQGGSHDRIEGPDNGPGKNTELVTIEAATATMFMPAMIGPPRKHRYIPLLPIRVVDLCRAARPTAKDVMLRYLA